MTRQTLNTELDINIVEAIITSELDDLLAFGRVILAFLTESSRTEGVSPPDSR